MKKILKGIILSCTFLCAFSLSGCGSNEPVEDMQAKRQYEYFDVVEMINSGEYDEAKTRIDEVYTETDYSTTEGFNKAILMKMYYEKQEKYDEAMNEMLKAYKDGDYAKKISDGVEGTEEEISARTIVTSINVLLENVSEEKKAETLSYI